MLRKLISLVLGIILCTAAMFPIYAEEAAPVEKRITKIQKAVDEGGEEALWELINTHYATNAYKEEDCSEMYIWAPDGPVFPCVGREDEHVKNYYMVDMMVTNNVGLTLEQVLTYTVQPDGTCILHDLSRDLLPAGPERIAPGYVFSYRSTYPADGTSRYEIVAAAGTDDNGHELEFYGVIQRLNYIPYDAAEIVPVNPDYDIDRVRYEADFRMILADGVWWVPINMLGRTRYTNREIADMVEHSPEEKQEEISTLYEAIQLFRISGFTYTEDNVEIPEGEVKWEHHKPGRDAVRTNTGCCAADSNWLNYILNGDYEQIGFLSYSCADSDGHVFNYIYQDGYYYFIDLTGYEDGYENGLARESGMPRDYVYSGLATGCLIKARSPENFVNYYVGICRNAPNLFFLYQGENNLPVAGIEIDGLMTMTYPEGYDIQILDGNEPEKLGVQFVEGPKKEYKWSALKNAQFKARDKYLRAADETAAEPLTAWKPGDVLTLEDNSDKGRAVIDGIKFGTSKRDEVKVGFEENLYLDGNGVNGVYNLSLPLERHSEAIKDMDSLVLGELNIDIIRTIPETQLVVCTRGGDQLTVQEVMDGKYYESRQISIRKDENGNWTEAPEYWYLIITNSKKMKYEFGRFKCEIKN